MSPEEREKIKKKKTNIRPMPERSDRRVVWVKMGFPHAIAHAGEIKRKWCPGAVEVEKT